MPRRELKRLIEKLLYKAGKEGLTLGQLLDLLRQEGEEFSERTIRRILNELDEEERVTTIIKKQTPGPGRPERILSLIHI